MNSPHFVRQANAALRPVLGDDDRIVAGAQVLSGPSPSAVTALTIAVLLASVIALICAIKMVPHGLHLSAAFVGFVVAEAIALLLGAIRFVIQRRAFIAVSAHSVVCARLGRHNRLQHVRTANKAAATITDYRAGKRTTSIRCELPGEPAVRLNAVGDQRANLDDVLSAVLTADGARSRPGRHSRPGPLNTA